MFTVSVIGHQPNAGKTTLAAALAVAAERSGLHSILVELDPEGRIMDWTSQRKPRARNAVPRAAPICCRTPADKLAAVLECAGHSSVGARFAVIDAAAGTADVALGAAHLALVVCRPPVADIAAHLPTFDTPVPTFAVLNLAPVHGKITDRARTAIAGHGIACVPVVVHQRTEHGRAWKRGLTAQELIPNSKAAAEVGSLFDWLQTVQARHRLPSGAGRGASADLDRAAC